MSNKKTIIRSLYDDLSRNKQSDIRRRFSVCFNYPSKPTFYNAMDSDKPLVDYLFFFAEIFDKDPRDLVDKNFLNGQAETKKSFNPNSIGLVKAR